jgi:voltage-gated potassium channel
MTLPLGWIPLWSDAASAGEDANRTEVGEGMKFIDTIKELLLIYAALVLLCAGLYAYLENTTYLNGIWWACVTALTVGYGDMFPASMGGKIVAVLLMHATVLFILPLLIGNICVHCIRTRHEFTHEEQEDIKAMLRRLEERLDAVSEKRGINA